MDVMYAGSSRDAAPKLEPVAGYCQYRSDQNIPGNTIPYTQCGIQKLANRGGHKVSAIRKNNITTWFKITAGKSGIIKIRNNFGKRKYEWSMTGIKKRKDNYEIYLEKGRSITASLLEADKVL